MIRRRPRRDGPAAAEAPILYEPPSRLATWHRAIAWGLFGLALLVRAAYLKQLQGSPLWDDLPVDLGYYRDWALRIAAGDWVGKEVFEQSPLYAYFLAVVFKIAGPGLLAPRLVQIVVGSITCVLIYLTGRLVFSPGAALAAGLMAALYGPFLFYDAMLMKEVFAVFLTAAVVYQLHLGNASQRGLIATSGLCLGLAALVRDNTILVAAPIALWLALDPWLRGGAAMRLRQGAGRIAALAVGLLLVIVPVAARNYHVSGELVPLTAGGGEVFYIGNNPEADGRYAPPPFVRASSAVEHEDFRTEAARRLGRGVTRNEASGYWLRQGLAWIAAHPGDWAALLWRKLVIFWNHHELPDSHSYEHHRRLLPILRLPLLSFRWLVPLAAAGVALSLSRWRDLLGLYLIGGGYVTSVLLFFNFGRFRMPLIPILMLLAGCGAVQIAASLTARRFLRAAVAVSAAAAAFLAAGWDLRSDPLHLGQSHAQLAELLLRAGRIAEADAESRESLTLLEGLHERAGGRPDLGRSFFAVLGEAYGTRARISRAQGRTAEADAWARRAEAAFGSVPDHPARFRLSLRRAEALHRSGRPREALAAVEEALAAAPELSPLDLADAHYGQALIYRDLGEPERMRFHMRECLRLNGSHPQADWMRRMLEEW